MNSIIIFCAQYFIVLVVLGIAIAWLRSSRKAKLQFAVTTIVAGLIALALSRVAAALYYDPRPFVSEHVVPLIKHAADNGFPSDHALLTMTLTATAYFFSKKTAGALLILTIIVGVARVLAKVHSPLDIVGAWVIGIASSAVAYYLVRWLFRHYNKVPDNQNEKAADA